MLNSNDKDNHTGKPRISKISKRGRAKQSTAWEQSDKNEQRVTSLIIHKPRKAS